MTQDTTPQAHKSALFALEDLLAKRLTSDPAPLPMTRALAIGKATGCPPSITRHALHRLARRGLLVFVADPTAVVVRGANHA